MSPPLFVVDDWYDWWRFGIFLGCCVCVCFLVIKFWRARNLWNAKTRDVWFSTFMWVCVGLVGSIQAIFFHVQFGPALVFMTAATLATLSAVLRKGSWGANDSR